MTCIVGIIDKESRRVLIGADSAGVSGYDITVRKDQKVFRNGKFVIGCTSSFRMIQLLQYKFKPPKIKGMDLHEYMCTKFVDKVRRVFESGGYLKKSNEVESGGQFLVGYKDRLFSVDSDFQVQEVADNYDAIGCGDAYAKGVLYAYSKENARDAAFLALTAAEKHSAGVCAPFNIITT